MSCTLLSHFLIQRICKVCLLIPIQVTVPFIGPLSKLGSAAEGMIVVDIDMQVLEDAEANYQIRSDIDRNDWHYNYRHSRLDNPNSKDNENWRDEKEGY